MTEPVHKLIIIGSGPAGLTAAIYAARSGLSPLVIAGHEPGGQLTLTTEVEDFPGFPDGIEGPELMERMRHQAERFGTAFINDAVRAVDFKTRPFTPLENAPRLGLLRRSPAPRDEGRTAGFYGSIRARGLMPGASSLTGFTVWVGEQAFKTMSVIVATGASARWLGLPSEKRLIGHGVSSCAVCDGYFFKNKDVVVVGGGDSALREALYLAKLASRVTIIHRRESFRAQQILEKRAREDPKISWCVPMWVEEILGESAVTGVRLQNAKTGEIKTLDCHGVFVAIGYKPNTEPFQGQLELDDAGYIISRDGVSTSVEGVFVAGDVCDQKYRQAVTAAGAGCAAVMEAEEYLEGLKSKFKS